MHYNYQQKQGLIWLIQVNKQLQQAGDEHSVTLFTDWGVIQHCNQTLNYGLAQFYHKVSHIESLSTTTLLFVVTYSSYLMTFIEYKTVKWFQKYTAWLKYDIDVMVKMTYNFPSKVHVVLVIPKIYGNTVWTIQEINTNNFICRELL